MRRRLGTHSRSGRGVLAALATGAVLSPLALTSPASADIDITVTACLPGQVPSAGFSDAPPATPATPAGERAVVSAIDCLALYGITSGTTDTEYGRGSAVSRQQMAVFLTRIATHAGVELDTSDAGFVDLGGRPAGVVDAVNALANLGVAQGRTATTFGPSEPVTRGQMATFLNRLQAAVAGTGFEAEGDAFTDDEGSVHEDAINAIAAAEVATGTGGGAFSPEATVTRQQMALFLARYLELVSRLPLGVDLWDATIPELLDRLEAGELTSTRLVQAYFARIEAIDKSAPALNSVLSIHPGALAEAVALDAERRAGILRGPLHGIPIILKDNIDLEGLPTTAGSVALAENYPGSDAPVARELKEAGAVITAKANLSEFAYFMTSGAPSGYSSLGGQVLNPYDISQTPSGSSSGSAVAAAASLAAGAVGSETSGSILSPARANSLAAVKPTVGLVSRTGIIPISATQDTAGPLTRSVTGAALMLTGMAADAADPEDPATRATIGDAAFPTDTVFHDELSDTALQGARIGYVEGEEEDPVVLAAFDALRAQGATLVPVTVPNTEAPSILTFEFERDLNAYLARVPEETRPMETLAEIVAYNRANADRALKFGQVRLEASEEIDLTDPATLAEYEAAREQGLSESRATIDGVLADNDLDAIVSASRTTGVGARAGYPSVAVPAGYSEANRRPVGIVFLGTAYSEESLLSLAYDFEQATTARVSPLEVNPTAYRCLDEVGLFCATS